MGESESHLSPIDEIQPHFLSARDEMGPGKILRFGRGGGGGVEESGTASAGDGVSEMKCRPTRGGRHGYGEKHSSGNHQGTCHKHLTLLTTI